MKDTIGRYRVEKKIGEGAMGVVYLAYDSMIDRRVAIKSLRLERLKNQSEGGRIRHLFFHEAKIIGKLNHSHITAIYDMGQENGNPYLVMEYVNGKTIKELIKSGEPFPLGEKLTLLAMVARALHYAHQRGVIHRDIKPANIMILANNTPKVMDFGIAAMQGPAMGDGGNIAYTEDGIILGTPGYMSPEQILAKELDQRSDIFSLGILAHEWIGGKKPFKGRNLKEVLTAVISKPAGSLKKICGADEELCRIVDKALAKKRKERYRSAEQFSDAIELYMSKIEKEKSGAGASLSYNSIRIIERLRKNYLFFSDFTDEELFYIFKLSVKEKYKKGDVIIQEGTSGAKMYIIIRGSVVIEKETNGQKLEVNRLEEGGCFGEMAIIDKMPRSASAVAAEETAVIAINEIVLRETNPQLCLKLYRSLAAMISEKLRLSDSKYMDIVSKIKNDVQ